MYHNRFIHVILPHCFNALQDKCDDMALFDNSCVHSRTLLFQTSEMHAHASFKLTFSSGRANALSFRGVDNFLEVGGLKTAHMKFLHYHAHFCMTTPP